MPISKCSPAQATSAMIKMIRLRRSADAIYWFQHLARCYPDDSFRLYRRILICAAEDCIEVPVQMIVYDWYKLALTSKDHERLIGMACYLISLMCSTRNWWSSLNGQRYILAWREAEKHNRAVEWSPERTVHTEAQDLDYAINGKDVIGAFSAHMRMMKLKANKRTYAEYLRDKAITAGNLPARLVAQVHVTNWRSLGFDENWVGQALWLLMDKPLGIGHYLEPDPAYLENVVAQSIAEVWDNSRTPPPWTQDGIHCSGKDTRFAGVLSSMVGCCNMFNRTGRLDPDDQWDNLSRSTEELKANVQE